MQTARTGNNDSLKTRTAHGSGEESRAPQGVHAMTLDVANPNGDVTTNSFGDLIGEARAVQRREAADILPLQAGGAPPQAPHSAETLQAELTETTVARQHPATGNIHISGVRYPAPVGKALDLDAEGKLIKVRNLAPRAGDGEVINESFTTAAEVFAFRRRAGCNVMLFAGLLPPERSTGDICVPYDRLEEERARFEGGNSDHLLSATTSWLAFRQEPTLLRIDVDWKKLEEMSAVWPKEGAFLLKSEEAVRAAVLELMPEAARAPMQIVPSSGAMIRNRKTGKMLSGPTGWRVEIAIDDGRAIPRILNLVHTRCWARGLFRYAFLGSSGNFYHRSIADLALARPTQPDYVRAELRHTDLEQVDCGGVWNGDDPPLEAAGVKPVGGEAKLAEQMIGAAREMLKPTAAKLSREAQEKHTRTLMDQGVPRKGAERAARLRFTASQMVGSDVVTWEDGSTIEAWRLLAGEGVAYDKRECLDPDEPDYDGGRAVGKFYWNAGTRPGIHSFAHASKWHAIVHDAESAAKAMEAAGADADAIVEALARLRGNDGIEMDRLEAQAAAALGVGRKALRSAVARRVEELRGQAAETGGPEGDDGREEEGAQERADAAPVPLNQRLNQKVFPYRHKLKTGDNMVVVDHTDNVAVIIERYGFNFRYNKIVKRLEWSHPTLKVNQENADNQLYAEVHSLCALNDVPLKFLGMHLTSLSARNAYNPVVDYLAALKWDGVERFGKLVLAMDPADIGIARIAMRIFLVQACAAADNGEIACQKNRRFRHVFECCLILVGAQGVNKTSGLRDMLPASLRKYFTSGVALNPDKRDDVVPAIRNWITELGEVGTTFRRADVNSLKNFASKPSDDLRLPYAREWSQFPRRTAFVGSTNDAAFLADETGNRRFLPLTVGRMNVEWPDEELDQLWAEAWARYVAGEQWWPTEEEAKRLAENAEWYRVRSAVEDRIERHWAWGRAPDWAAGRKTASEIYEMVAHRSSTSPGAASGASIKTVGNVLQLLWKRSGMCKEMGGVLKVFSPETNDWASVNSAGGKNRGWLLPPAANDAGSAIQQFGVVGGGKVSDVEDMAAEATYASLFE